MAWLLSLEPLWSKHVDGGPEFPQMSYLFLQQRDDVVTTEGDKCEQRFV